MVDGRVAEGGGRDELGAVAMAGGQAFEGELGRLSLTGGGLETSKYRMPSKVLRTVPCQEAPFCGCFAGQASR